MDNKFDDAVIFALNAHSGQKRKDGSIFILHPLEVATIVGTMTKDIDIISAAVLHDTVEDTGATIQDILENFGERVAELVASETENKRPDIKPSDTWQIRKEESLEILKNTDDEGVKILWLGDKLSNMRALAREVDKYGKDVFNRFNQNDPEKHAWYYRSIADYLSDLEDYPAYKEYKNLCQSVFDKFI